MQAGLMFTEQCLYTLTSVDFLLPRLFALKVLFTKR